MGRRAWIAFIAGVLAACTFAGSASAQIQVGDLFYHTGILPLANGDYSLLFGRVTILHR